VIVYFHHAVEKGGDSIDHRLHALAVAVIGKGSDCGLITAHCYQPVLGIVCKGKDGASYGISPGHVAIGVVGVAQVLQGPPFVTLPYKTL